jgi:hypothetical protein
MFFARKRQWSHLMSVSGEWPPSSRPLAPFLRFHFSEKRVFENEMREKFLNICGTISERVADLAHMDSS